MASFRVKLQPVHEELEDKFNRLKELQPFIKGGPHPDQAGAGVAENGDGAILRGLEQGVAQFLGLPVGLHHKALALKGLAAAETVEVLGRMTA